MPRICVLFCFIMLAACGKQAPDNSNIQTAQPEPASEAKAESKPKSPNILFILSDDHRWDLIGKRHPIIKTPTLDELADKGTVFNNAFVTTPICAASRASIFTGLTERTHQFTFERPPIDAAYMANSYPKLLQDAGYHTGFVGKFGVKVEKESEKVFDHFEPILQSIMNEYEGEEIPQTYYMAERSIDFIEEAQKNAPGKAWNLSLSFWNPHAHDADMEYQYHYPKEFESYYQNITIPPARLSEQEHFDALPPFLQKSIARTRWEWRYRDEATYQKMVKRHYRAITAVDAAIGRIVNRLHELGIADNTIIIYTGDNGYSLNERQLAGKWYAWEEDLRVPLIVYDPRRKMDSTNYVEHTALNTDLAPTMVDLAGAKPHSQYQGLSLAQAITSDANASSDLANRSEFFFEHAYLAGGRIPPMEGVRTGEWKYARYPQHGNYQQLYDLSKDPGEVKNLAKDPAHAKTLQSLSEKTDDYVEQYVKERIGSKSD